MAQGILLVISEGFTEEQVLDMAVDKYEHYLEAVTKNEFARRRSYITDTNAAIAGAFGGKGMKEYLNELTL